MTDCRVRQTSLQNQNAALADLLAYHLTDHITLAGQPQPEDWPQLVAEGYTFVVNMRSDAERAAIEEKNAVAAGLRYIHLDLPAYELEAEHLTQFHQVLQEAGDEKLFIHCRTATRVALIWMLNRVWHEGWSRETAAEELRQAGYDDDSMEVFSYCAEDFFERAVPTDVILQS